MEAWAVENYEWGVHKLLFWESDDVQKGRIVRIVHYFIAYALIFLVAFSHLIYPAFWLQTLTLFFVSIVWLQHVTCNGCVSSKVEQKLIGDSSSFIDPLLQIFKIEPTKELAIFTLIVVSTIGTNVLWLEWIARVHHKMFPVVSTWQTLALQRVLSKTE
jgi:hypothetical protein